MKIRTVELETVCGYTSKFPSLEYPQIAFAGRSNVGKSSLINALMQRKKLARVGQTPGKTRTINFYSVEAVTESFSAAEDDGTSAVYASPEPHVFSEESPIQFYLVDLPGYGYANISVQERMKMGALVERYLHTASGLKAVFLLVDIRHEPNANDMQMYEWIISAGYSPIVIATKADKIKRSQLQKQIKTVREGLGAPSDMTVIPFSALTKIGRDEIYAELTGILRKENLYSRSGML